MFELTGKVAVVVGGAGGIGQAVAAALARQGARVIVASRNMEKLEAAAQEINAATGAETTRWNPTPPRPAISGPRRP